MVQRTPTRIPGCIKDVQRLTGKLTALSRFLGASTERAIPFFNLMKKGIAFEWTPACEEVFSHFKKILSEPPVLSKPREGKPLYLYLAVTTQAMAAVLVREEDKTQHPIYFISKVLQGAELKYTKLDNLAYALLTSSRRLKQYFQGHVIILRTDQAIRQAKYEALIRGLVLAKEVGVLRVEVSSDSWIVTSQINGSYQARNALLQKYPEKVKELCKSFVEVIIQHVPRERNARADLLSKLASTKPGIGNRSLIQGLATEPAIILCATQIPNPSSWIDPILRYLEHGKTSENEKEAQNTRREASKYVIIQGQLYKRGLHQPLLKCLRPDQMDYVLSKVHEGCCGHHIGRRSLARKIIRAEYYWPTMMSDA
ncbi:uncharacterized protein [Arachis hypogaea]|uniref:uncharacterized protein n=1 Tax=Arachis hypogaea TaxID=3818 RepID=UPI003B2281B3